MLFRPGIKRKCSTLIGGLFDPRIVPWSQEMVGAVNGVLAIN